jgi:hypothetical protein
MYASLSPKSSFWPKYDGKSTIDCGVNLPAAKKVPSVGTKIDVRGITCLN